MNGEPEPSKLSSSCSKMPPHVHLDHIDHNEDWYSHHEQQTEQPMERPVKHKGDKQAAEHREAQTHHEAESRSHTCNKAQEQPSDPCMTDKWQETTKDQECQSNAKQQRSDRRKHQWYHHPDEEAAPDK
jgi:hypothetical protein